MNKGKTKIISGRGKFRHTLNSSEKVFYGADTKFSYTECQWTEAKAEKMGMQIHHKCVDMVENAEWRFGF